MPEQFLLMASPYITCRVMNWVGDCLSRNASRAKLQILCLTNLRIDSILSGSLELEGIVQMGRSFPKFSVTHLPSLHAKVFIADDKRAIVTSGNLTDGGLRKNCEYGVAIGAAQIVDEIRRDFEGYAQLGAPVSIDEISALADELAGARAKYQAESRRLISEIKPRFKIELRSAADRVLRLRAKSDTTQGIFRKTILYLLAKRALRTSELNPLIQQIHPDLCDDSIDRVIGGMNFGKKWKHYVRNAQQALKRDGLIVLDGEKWKMAKL